MNPSTILNQLWLLRLAYSFPFNRNLIIPKYFSFLCYRFDRENVEEGQFSASSLPVPGGSGMENLGILHVIDRLEAAVDNLLSR